MKKQVEGWVCTENLEEHGLMSLLRGTVGGFDTICLNREGCDLPDCQAVRLTLETIEETT